MRIGTGASCGPETICGFGFEFEAGFAAPFAPASFALAGLAGPPPSPLPLVTTAMAAAMATTSTRGRRKRIAGRGYASRIVTQHARHYTVEQANAALEWVVERLERLRPRAGHPSARGARAPRAGA